MSDISKEILEKVPKECEECNNKIIEFYYETEEEFLRELFSAELQYARTRRFW